MKKKFLVFSLAIIFAITSNIANAANTDSTGGMFFLNSNSESHDHWGAFDEEDAYTDTGETTGLSRNAKIALGIGAGILVAGGITAAIIAAHHHDGDENGETPVDENITIQADSDPANQHLQYRAFNINNNSTQVYKINHLSFASSSARASDVLKLCNIDANCLDFNSTCLPDKELQPGESCKLWVHAIDGTAGLGSHIETLTISVQNMAIQTFTKQQTFAITYNKDLYAGGQFTSAGGNNAHFIAKWNGTAWSALGLKELDNTVRALTIGPGGDLYAGGQFTKTTDDEITLNHIARWNGASWSPLASGLNNNVAALASSPDGDLYAGGEFTDHIAKWNGSEWSAMENGFNDPVRALAIDPDSSLPLYAGGEFDHSGSNEVNYIAKWDGNSWSAMGSFNGLNNNVYALTIAPDGSLYAGGEFTDHIAKWDGNSWSPMDDGLDDIVYALVIAPDGSLYAGGAFLGYGGTVAWHIAQWKQESGFWDWYAVGDPQTLNNTVLALAIGPDGSLYAGGMFNTTYNYIAKWNGTAWSTVGSDMNQKVDALLVAPSIQSVQ